MLTTSVAAQHQAAIVHQKAIAAGVARFKGINIKRAGLYGECPKAVKLESLNQPVIDGEGNTTEFGELIADDATVDLDAWVSSSTWELSYPKRLVTIAYKLNAGIQSPRQTGNIFGDSDSKSKNTYFPCRRFKPQSAIYLLAARLGQRIVARR